jgi:hypothetical protein
MTTSLHRADALLAQALQLQTCRGIVNVRHNEKPDHDLVLWNDGEERRLSVKLDHGQNPDVKFEAQPQKATTGPLIGTALGALIGGLITGNTKAGSSEPARVSDLQSLIGVKSASAEGEMTRRGYTYRGGEQIGDSAFSSWQQPNSGNCLSVRTTESRYQSITSSEPAECS